MKKKWIILVCIILILLGCKQKNIAPSPLLIKDLGLKRGEVIVCGSPDLELGLANFESSCSEKSRNDFNMAVKFLHSFEYDEAEKVFTRVIDQDPACAMAYWGIAMSNFHPLWDPPSVEVLKKGVKAIQVAASLNTSRRETEYIDAIAAYYKDWETTDHRTRCLNFEKGMEKVYTNNPKDDEAAVFYALALNAAADPRDKTFQKQKKAGKILESLYPGQPEHPGIAHYLIHSYDYPELAQEGLEAARKYAAIAPSSAHALHMPSHIFTRLGLWDEVISSNLASVYSARCYAEAAGIKGHWDEELHGLDYLVYAYLQKGENDSALKYWKYLNEIRIVKPENFKTAYAFAAIPSRYVLENKMWEQAAHLAIKPEKFPWEKFPWQESIIHFTRVMGAVHTGKLSVAKEELAQLQRLHAKLTDQKNMYEASQVAIQIKVCEAWIQLKEEKKEDALSLMKTAADMEDQTEKHPVTPGEVVPARELLGDMFLALNDPASALEAYKATLKKHPNRFNSLYGAGLAAEVTGDMQTAGLYFGQLLKVTGNVKPGRPEINRVRKYVRAGLKMS
jgi:tetratricopeptide (TPR) repeat protein